MKHLHLSKTIHNLGLAAIAGLVATASASAQITIGPATTTFTDIAATGTSPGSAVDDSEHTVTSATLSAAGFAGNELLPLANIRIGNNGSVLWNATTGDVGYINSTTFPTMTPMSVSGPNGNGGLTPGASFLCPLWDDNTPASSQGANALDWQVIGGNLIIQWSNEAHYNAGGPTGGTVQYQAIIYGGATIASGAPLVDFVYNDTLYAASQYPNDGGSATIGYKNWGTVAAANDVEYGLGGGDDTINDPPFGGANMQPKVGGYLANENPNLPRAVRISGLPSSTAYCSGDGSGTACPCGNSGAAGNGCAHSLSASGGNLATSGTPSISADTLSLDGSNMPNSSALYFQGTAQVAAGAGAAFGDGLRCVAGSVTRLGTKLNILGASQYPTIGDAAISVKGMNAAGNVRYYQCWFRNADPTFCTSATFNLTNGIQLTWTP